MESRLNVILVSDIYGRTSALDALADQLTSDQIQVRIADPYSNAQMNFETQAKAYSCFMETIGLESYKTILLDAISDISDPFFFIGFSVGAAATWMLSCEHKIQGRAVCFYGSQIRHYLNGSPTMETECIFPDHEPHFDVQSLVQNLSVKKNVTCTTVPCSHGFMNRHSRNYDHKAYEKYIGILKHDITHHRLI